MTLTELKYIVALAQTRHFGKAADVCFVSQPTLSVAINKLETELGVSLFERDRNNVRLTEIGEEVVAQAQRVLDEATVLSEMAEGAKSQVKSPLKVGAIYTVGPYLFPNLIPKLKKIAPEMPLIIEENFTVKLREKLLQGKLDAIFISLPFAEPGIVTQTLYDEPFVILMPNTHPLTKKTSVKAGDLNPDEMLLLGEGHCFRKQVIDACPNCYPQLASRQKILEGASIETIRHMVASGIGIAVLPASATQIQYYKSTLCTRPFAGNPPERQIALAWRTSFTRPKAIGMLIKGLQEAAMKGVSLVTDK